MILRVIRFLVKLYKAKRFEREKSKAIKEAKRKAKEEKRKYLVLLHNKKLYVLSSKGIKELIRKRYFKRSFTMQKAHEVAIFVAYPPTK